MDDANSPLARYLQDTSPLLADQVLRLRSLPQTIGALRPEFIARWKTLLDQDSTHPELKRLRSSTERMEWATQVFLDALGDRTDPNLSKYLRGASAWSLQSHAVGLAFTDQARLLTQFRRALFPFLLHESTAGPELELVFTALDAYERVLLGVFALAGIQLAQSSLTEGAHLRSVGRLTGGMAHALNNSLAVIVGRAQILEEQVTDSSQLQELQEIQKTARSGADALKRLQHFAASHDAGADTRLDVNAIIADVIPLTRFRWRDDAEASGITIQVVQDTMPVEPVLGQEALLRDALVELILNGVEAMPLGGIVTVHSEQVQNKVHLLVIDGGEGMDAPTGARAPEPFFTTKGSGHVGMGLPTVAGLVEQLGGTFALDSSPGEGTTARIVLPVAPQKTADARPSRVARWASILVVDDEPLVRDVAARTFHLRGFRTVSADSGADALRVFTEQGPFEVVIVDLGMPKMNGFETARALKDLNPRTIIILMTGWAAELDPNKMRQAGIDRAIAKPFDADQLIQLISEALAIQEKI